MNIRHPPNGLRKFQLHHVLHVVEHHLTWTCSMFFADDHESLDEAPKVWKPSKVSYYLLMHFGGTVVRANTTSVWIFKWWEPRDFFKYPFNCSLESSALHIYIPQPCMKAWWMRCEELAQKCQTIWFQGGKLAVHESYTQHLSFHKFLEHHGKH